MELYIPNINHLVNNINIMIRYYTYNQLTGTISTLRPPWHQP